MESNNNYQEESTNSSTDQEVVMDDRELGVGRSYECVFCKRGFNTAQALGGHMNIHRKDRARNNKPNSNKHFQEARLYHQIMPSSPATQSLNHRFLPPDHHLSYATYFPEYSSTTNDYLDGEASEDPLEWRMSLSLEFPPAIMEDLEKKRRLAMTQEKDLDLELRLGYD